MRWQNYVLNKTTNHCETFWKNYLESGERDILYVLGIGFDPRTQHGITTIFGCNGRGKRDAFLLRYYNNKEEIDKEPIEVVKNHQSDVISLVESKSGQHTNIPLIIRSEEDRSVASIKASDIIKDIETVKPYSDVLVDISAMPRAVFIPLLNKLLQVIDSYNKESEQKINVHVIASENFKLDSSIQDDGTEQTAEFIQGLSISDITKTKDYKEVFISVLGEKQLEQFKKIKSSINPASVCVVLPFPSKKLRRGDELIMYYKDELLNDKSFDFNNIIYVDEQNPFQAYRLIKSAIDRFNESFQLLGGCKVIVSALSSKLLTIGAFLAVYESKKMESKEKLRVGIKHVESISHKFDLDSAKQEGILEQNELFHLWIAGTPYKE